MLPSLSISMELSHVTNILILLWVAFAGSHAKPSDSLIAGSQDAENPTWIEVKEDLANVFHDAIDDLEEQIKKLATKLEDLKIEEMVEDRRNKKKQNKEIGDSFALNTKWLKERGVQLLITGTASKPALPDSALTSSASWDRRHAPRCSRMGVAKPQGCFSTSWSRGRGDIYSWLQVDLGRIHDVHVIVTQGRADATCKQWVTSYNLRYNAGAAGDSAVAEWKYYSKNAVGIFAEELTGNTDRHTPVAHVLDPVMRARFVRVYPLACHGHCSLRWDLIGRPSMTEETPPVEELPEDGGEGGLSLSSEETSLDISAMANEENSWETGLTNEE